MRNLDKVYPVTKYITIGKKRLIFRDGRYNGFYIWK